MYCSSLSFVFELCKYGKRLRNEKKKTKKRKWKKSRSPRASLLYNKSSVPLKSYHYYRFVFGFNSRAQRNMRFCVCKIMFALQYVCTSNNNNNNRSLFLANNKVAIEQSTTLALLFLAKVRHIFHGYSINTMIM